MLSWSFQKISNFKRIVTSKHGQLPTFPSLPTTNTSESTSCHMFSHRCLDSWPNLKQITNLGFLEIFGDFPYFSQPFWGPKTRVRSLSFGQLDVCYFDLDSWILEIPKGSKRSMDWWWNFRLFFCRQKKSTVHVSTENHGNSMLF